MKTDKRKQSDTAYRNKTKQVKQEFYRQVGAECLFCGSKTRLVCHRKDFTAHERIANLTRAQVKNENIDDYARLCFPCHFGVHWAHTYLSLSWSELEVVGSNPTSVTN